MFIKRQSIDKLRSFQKRFHHCQSVPDWWCKHLTLIAACVKAPNRRGVVMHTSDMRIGFPALALEKVFLETAENEMDLIENELSFKVETDLQVFDPSPITVTGTIYRGRQEFCNTIKARIYLCTFKGPLGPAMKYRRNAELEDMTKSYIINPLEDKFSADLHRWISNSTIVRSPDSH